MKARLSTIVCAVLTMLTFAAPASADVAFTSATNIPTNSTFPSELVTADFNQDGAADLATVECGDVCATPDTGSNGAVTSVLHPVPCDMSIV